MIDLENSHFPVTEEAKEAVAKVVAQIIMARYEAAVKAAQLEAQANYVSDEKQEAGRYQLKSCGDQ